MQKQYVAYVLIAIVALPFVMSSHAFAQQYGQANPNAPTLEESLKLAKERIAIVEANPHAGSGTPFLSGGDTITAMVVSALIFGTLFILFVYRAHTIALKREQEARR